MSNWREHIGRSGGDRGTIAPHRGQPRVSLRTAQAHNHAVTEMSRKLDSNFLPLVSSVFSADRPLGRSQKGWDWAVGLADRRLLAHAGRVVQTTGGHCVRGDLSRGRVGMNDDGAKLINYDYTALPDTAERRFARLLSRTAVVCDGGGVAGTALPRSSRCCCTGFLRFLLANSRAAALVSNAFVSGCSELA